MPAVRGVEGIAMKDDYYLMEPPPVEAVEACPCCGSSARVWVYSEDPTMPVTRVVMCDHSDSIGPRDSLVYEGCLLQMPPDDFYRETGRDAVRYWNEYAKALTAAQRANRWNTSQVLRGPQSDIAAAAHAKGLRERIAELEAQRVPLTKAEITACCNESDTYKTGVWMRVHETTLERLVRAIERAHGIEEAKR